MVQKDNIKDKIIIVCGPTASSKTALAIELAKLLDSEIISADSMNVYKGFDIGTAKPNEEEKKEAIHHLIDVVEPSKTFSVGDYKELAEPIIKNLINRSKIPIICGGTGFYINSLIYDLSYGNTTGNLEIRSYYKKLAEEKGNLEVYNILKQKDEASANKLHYNDLKRVIRALEIYYSGTKKSDIIDQKTPKYNYFAYSIAYDRQTLYDRINLRVDNMIKQGLVEEVKSLMNLGININHQAMQGIGYKEIYAHLVGDCDLETAIENIKLNTRHYAKRQITFFKKLEGKTDLQPDDIKILAKGIVDKL